MPYFHYEHIKISAIASAVPTTVVKTDDYKERFGETIVEKFESMVGVQQHRETSKYQTASDLGYVAAVKIFQDKNICREKIGALVFATHSPDYRKPATACVLHKRLGLSKECAAFDVSLGCSAFVYGMQLICSMLANSDMEKALLIVGDTATKTIHPEDRSVAMLFGDAGSAILFEKTEAESGIQVLLGTDGMGYRNIIIPGGGFRNLYPSDKVMVWKDENKRTLYNTYMNGMEVFNFTISEVPEAIQGFFEKTRTSQEDYDCFAMHQANQYIHKRLQKQLKIPTEKMPLCLDRFGNTSAASIPIALCDFYGMDSAKEQKDILMCGFGIGFSWGVASARVNTEDIYEVMESDDYFEEGVINGPGDMRDAR